MPFSYFNQRIDRCVHEFADDYNRVTLSTGGEDEYINASFIEVRVFYPLAISCLFTSTNFNITLLKLMEVFFKYNLNIILNI